MGAEPDRLRLRFAFFSMRRASDAIMSGSAGKDSGARRRALSDRRRLPSESDKDRLMGSHDDYSAKAFAGAEEHEIARSNFLRIATRQTGLLVASLVAGFAVGVAYRFFFDLAGERDLADFVRSGIQGVGVALAIFAVWGSRRAHGPDWARRCDGCRSRPKSSSGRSSWLPH